MPSFLTGLVLAIGLAVLSVVGLNIVDRSTPDAFYTPYTVPEEHDTVPSETR